MLHVSTPSIFMIPAHIFSAQCAHPKLAKRNFFFTFHFSFCDDQYKIFLALMDGRQAELMCSSLKKTDPCVDFKLAYSNYLCQPVFTAN